MNMQFSGFDDIQLILFLISFSVFVQKPVPLYLKLFPVYLFFGLVVSMVDGISAIIMADIIRVLRTYGG